jgi:hypothetical protein
MKKVVVMLESISYSTLGLSFATAMLLIVLTSGAHAAGCAVVNPTSGNARVFAAMFVASNYCKSVFKRPMTGAEFFVIMKVEKVFADTQGEDLKKCADFSKSLRDEFMAIMKKEGEQAMCSQMEMFMGENPAVKEFVQKIGIAH